MPATLQAALLGIVQGLTEFLPVSSSAHLILARALFGWDSDQFGLPFDVACHVGTLVAVAIYFRRELAQMVASLPRLLEPARDASARMIWLLVIGTIPAVIFDRIRENMRSMRRDSLRDIINASVNQTLSRTVITSGTALLTALALFFFGGEVLHGFAFTMIVGIVTGTYSSVFVAAAIVTFWRRKAPSKLAASPAAVATASAPARRAKSARKVRAS